MLASHYMIRYIWATQLKVILFAMCYLNSIHLYEYLKHYLYPIFGHYLSVVANLGSYSRQ
jgi:hypothetical protein